LRRKNILVVGDWVVDEHWVIGIHRSPTSSRTGHSHYRALHGSTSNVESLCGAGRSASILHQVMSGNERFCEILGIGLWHKEDTDTLAAMLAPNWSAGLTPHRVSRPAAPTDGNRLFNLCNLLQSGGTAESYGTTRMIRIYQHTGAKFDLLHRIDWEIQIPSEETGPSGEEEAQREVAWITEKRQLDGTDLDVFVTRHQATIDAVVIKDMHKGVVSKKLVQWLAQRFDHVPWFVSTKSWYPRWFDSLPRQNVRLLIVPQMAAQWAVKNGKLNGWITRSRGASEKALSCASEKALKELDCLGGEEYFKEAIVVVLPDGLSVLARDRSRSDEPSKRLGVVQTESGPTLLEIGMPMASVLFPAMIALLLRDEGIGLAKLLKDALDFTYDWMTREVKRVRDPEGWRPSEKQILNLESARPAEEPPGETPFYARWHLFDWQEARQDWKQALSKYGVISNGATSRANASNKRLELWRTMTEVNGYVCRVQAKRDILQKVVNEIKSFEPKERRGHKSFMFIASPGSGKTFLVRCLAESLNFRFLGFNITQMLSKNDLLDCFDTIVTSQTQSRDERLLVFFDEINAKLDGQYVYDIFLAPLEELVYVRAGKTFHIDPCVWVFAGTERPHKTSGTDKSDKASDFESRLTLDPLDLKIDLKKDESTALEARVEKVYMGVSLLRSVFPDVRRISKKVLQAFDMLPPSLEARDLRHFVHSFVDIQYGEVKARNIPRRRFEELCLNISTWNDEPEGPEEMVEIFG
jgi:hypothetical protein